MSPGAWPRPSGSGRRGGWRLGRLLVGQPPILVRAPGYTEIVPPRAVLVRIPGFLDEEREERGESSGDADAAELEQTVEREDLARRVTKQCHDAGSDGADCEDEPDTELW